MSVALWVCGAVTALSALVGLGYSIAGLRGADTAARTGSLYAFARSLALATVAIIAPLTGAAPFVIAIAVAMVVVQAADAVIGAILHDRLKTFGPAATAIVNLGALIWLLLQ
jgi:hypothetical protein